MDFDLELNNHIADHYNSEFVWGENDCTTFTTEWADKFGSNLTEKVKNKYSCRRSGYKLQKKIGTLNDLLESANWSKTKSQIKNGDIITKNDGMFECGHIYYNGVVYSIDENFGFVGINISHIDFRQDKLHIWRYNG